MLALLLLRWLLLQQLLVLSRRLRQQDLMLLPPLLLHLQWLLFLQVLLQLPKPQLPHGHCGGRRLGAGAGLTLTIAQHFTLSKPSPRHRPPGRGPGAYLENSAERDPKEHPGS